MEKSIVSIILGVCNPLTVGNGTKGETEEARELKEIFASRVMKKGARERTNELQRSAQEMRENKEQGEGEGSSARKRETMEERDLQTRLAKGARRNEGKQKWEQNEANETRRCDWWGERAGGGNDRVGVLESRGFRNDVDLACRLTQEL